MFGRDTRPVSTSHGFGSHFLPVRRGERELFTHGGFERADDAPVDEAVAVDRGVKQVLHTRRLGLDRHVRGVVIQRVVPVRGVCHQESGGCAAS